MANGCSTTTTSSLLLFFLLSYLLIGHALCSQGHNGRTSGSSLPCADYVVQYLHQELPGKHIVLQETVKGLNKGILPKYARRMLIGSIAPICTYNECRGCRFKCTAEQVPVDANDPMNSAYHYKCVCHR
ncbi:EPIDERMAL PATTERNING FACTOR-like protein 9 [Zea mays]|uniref:EPIDERMAL PATTERNING FACTOR-like protein 9 n=1 Tax=Zea mays TaxID=4577 RepID=A0A1D6N3D6_MAIZE|nr:EPIDERMAL PATTERNING FACTOR-like protein 9 [Zea mays]